MATEWRKLRELSSQERWLLFQAALLLPVMALGIRSLGMGRCQAALARLVLLAGPALDESRASLAQARATARLVKAARNHGIYQANCLQLALTLWWLLRRQGIQSDLRIGVRKEATGLQAHAWVEYRGQVLTDRDDVSQRFVPFTGAIAPVALHQ